MNYQEEQQLELEALASLYSNEGEFKKLAPDTFTLLLTPYGDDTQTHIVMRIRYTEQYPDTPPEWFFDEVHEINAALEQKLKTLIEDTIQQSLGYPMVYTITEAVQTLLSEQPNVTEECNLVSFSSAHDKESGLSDDEAQSEDSSVEELQYRGLELKELCASDSRITEEQFLQWKKTFYEEMVNKNIWVPKQNSDKLTGKQMFLRDQSLAKTAILEDDSKLEELHEEASGTDSRVMWVNGQLFLQKDSDVLDEDAFSTDNDAN